MNRNRKLNKYDRIAVVYDSLARLVFGRNLEIAQAFYLSSVKRHSRILVLGGGTGWLLEQLLIAMPASNIWYIDASKKMINMSKRRAQHNARVVFVHGTEDDIPTEVTFDLVVTNFFLDQFTEADVNSLCIKFRKCLCPDGNWLVTDFIESVGFRNRILLTSMYLFFRFVGAVSVRSLPKWFECISLSGFYCVKEKTFYNGAIKTVLFSKKEEAVKGFVLN